jgi:hypothetical protein
MDAFETMCLLNRQNHLGNVESCYGFMKYVFSDQKAEKIAAGHVFHDQVEIRDVLKTGHKGNDPARVGISAALSGRLFASEELELTILNLPRPQENLSPHEGGLLGCFEACPTFESPSWQIFVLAHNA